MLLAQTTPLKTILLTPIVFGLAHVHHFYEFRLSNPHVPAAAALARSVLQLAYTTLFGAYAAFLFLRTGSLAAVCAVHAFCNCMGLPQVWGRVEPVSHPSAAAAAAAGVVPVLAGGDVGEDGVGAGQKVGSGRPSILWTVAYYALLVTGAVMWWKNLWVLSESENALVPTSAFSKGSA